MKFDPIDSTWTPRDMAASDVLGLWILLGILVVCCATWPSATLGAVCGCVFMLDVALTLWWAP